MTPDSRSPICFLSRQLESYRGGPCPPSLPGRYSAVKVRKQLYVTHGQLERSGVQPPRTSARQHGEDGRHTIQTGHTGLIDGQLRSGVANSQAIFERRIPRAREDMTATTRIMQHQIELTKKLGASQLIESGRRPRLWDINTWYQ